MMKTGDNECEMQDNEAQFRINVFNVTLDRIISEVTRRFETTEQLNNMFCFLWSPSSSTRARGLRKFRPITTSTRGRREHLQKLLS